MLKQNSNVAAFEQDEATELHIYDGRQFLGHITAGTIAETWCAYSVNGRSIGIFQRRIAAIEAIMGAKP